METEKAYFAGGCFWCLEAAFKIVPGVMHVTSGYAGGKIQNPTYKEVTSGSTGHAETVEMEYDPSIVSYSELLHLFFKVHDPSQKDRQGDDVGTQYRSAIFYVDKEQKVLADTALTELMGLEIFHEIFTELLPLDKFWPAEEYHQNYFEKHPDQAYCQLIVRLKVDKVKELLKEI